MRFLRLTPLTFLAGPHGFSMFASYAILSLTVLHLARRRKQAALQALVK